MNELCKTDDVWFRELEMLRSQNAELRKLASNLAEAVSKSHYKEMSWVYALEGNRDGVWDWNAVTNEVFFSTRWKEMLGFEEHEISNKLSEWEMRIHPDDRAAVFAELRRHLDGETPFYETEHRVRCKDGSYKWILDRGRIISWTGDGKPLRIVGTHTDVTLRKQAELEKERLIRELKEANSKIRVLTGFLPICASCKRIRDEKGRWNQMESYLRNHSDVQFSHGLCPDCVQKAYQSLLDDDKPKT